MVISDPFWAVATTGLPSMGLIWPVPMPIRVANSSDMTLLLKRAGLQDWRKDIIVAVSSDYIIIL